MDMHEKPQPRITTESTEGCFRAKYEAPFVYDDGWGRITVGWHEEEMRDEDGKWVGAWVAQIGPEAGAYGLMGHSRTSQLHAMAELVRSIGGLVGVYQRTEARMHRTINNSPDTLVAALRDARDDLGKVQRYITTHVEPSDTDNWDDGLKPLWRAGQAIDAFAARIAAPREGEEAA